MAAAVDVEDAAVTTSTHEWAGPIWVVQEFHIQGTEFLLKKDQRGHFLSPKKSNGKTKFFKLTFLRYSPFKELAQALLPTSPFTLASQRFGLRARREKGGETIHELKTQSQRCNLYGTCTRFLLRIDSSRLACRGQVIAKKWRRDACLAKLGSGKEERTTDNGG